MGRFVSRGLCLAVVSLSLIGFSACGGRKAGTAIFPGRVNLTPGTSASLTLGATLNFTASAQTSSGTNIGTTITYSSSDTSILNLSPNGVACAGHWDTTFSTCSGGVTGVVTVTATALGATSVPTYVFVHPQIDNVTVTGILLNGINIQEPCLSQTQSMTVEAHAYSQGTDVTTSVGPFTWFANNPAVVTLTGLPNTTYNPLTNGTYTFSTNEASATAAAPGTTYIYASVNGVSSTTFQQPTLTNSTGTTSPVLDFFSSCPIANIALTIGTAGSNQTSFVAAKGTAASNENAIATVVDVMGNSSLPNTDGGVLLTKTPLTWTASQPAAVGVGSTCQLTCLLSLSPGAGTVTASCSPPTCNIGFPLIPATLSGSASDPSSPLSLCNSFFQTATFSCQMVIPYPVYSSNVFVTPPTTVAELTPNAALSGVVTGSTTSVNVVSASTGCEAVSPATCNTSLYYLSTAKNSPGNENPLPVPPNSLRWDIAGDRVYMGSEFGAEIISPSNFGTSNSPFTALGTVTGNILAIAANGTSAAFSDTLHTPNQVYVVNASNSNSILSTPLNITGALTAAFSPDGLKTFIYGFDPNGADACAQTVTPVPCLYIYSPLQALQTIPLPASTTINSIAFSPNAAFAFTAQSTTTGTPNLTAYATCNNQVPTSPAPGLVPAVVSLPANPLVMKIIPNVHLDGQDSYGYPIPDGVHILLLDSTGFDIATAVITQPATGQSLCPQTLTFVSNDPSRPTQRVQLGQTIPGPPGYANFFASADGSLLYIVASDSASILIFNLDAGAPAGGIELLNNAAPLSADMSVDGGTIVISGSDGLLHEVTTGIGGFDSNPLSFPNLPNYLNAFCSFTPSAGPCTLTTSLAKP
jgi:hypothetical protein